MAEVMVDLLDEEWSALAELGRSLSETQWKMPSALPGWTAQDNLSHVVGTELMLMGEPAPDVAVDHLAHIDNPFSAAIEMWVEARRSQPGAAVLAEFEDVTARRLDQLRSMSDEDFSRVVPSPVGEVPYREFMHVRVFDSWMHEQDIRRAVGRPGHLEGPVVDAALLRFRRALGFIVGKRAGAPDGTSVVFEVVGPETTRSYPVVVEGRATVVEDRPDEPTVVLTMPIASFVALGGGRWTDTEAESAGGLTLEGDQDLGRRVLAGMAFTP